jgi:signal transduction histidine kinase
MRMEELLAEARAAAVREERARLSREHHDSVSQALYGIVMGARTAREVLEGGTGDALGPVAYVLELAEEGLAEMRSLVFGLRPAVLEREGLADALRGLAEPFRVRYGLDVRIEAEGTVPGEESEALYWIAREALQNAVKHAVAKSIRIAFRNDANGVTLSVADDGRGFDPTAGFPGHLGLTSMDERAAVLGGWVAIESAPGAGTTVSAWLPLASEGAGEGDRG